MQEGPQWRRGLPSMLLLVVLAQYTWNLTTQRPFVGYDVEGHMYYAATLVDEGRVPHPFEGWSTFHPPLYYLWVAALSWPTAPVWPAHLLEGSSAAAVLLMGAVAFSVTRRLGHPPGVAALATLLLLFLPCVQLTATMVGNEAFAAAFAALAAAAGIRLQEDPRSLRRAAATGLAVGLALATKFTGIFAAPALLVPFLRRDFDRGCLRAASIAVLVMLGVAGGPYLRNLTSTGSLVPMTRDREPVASVERNLTIRERRVTDYLWLDPSVFRLPVVHTLKGEGGRPGLNPAMTNVWGLAYASAWYDAHEVRVADSVRAAGVQAGRWLLLLGSVPTALMLLGGALSLRDVARRGAAAASAPLVAMAVVGGLAFVAFTARVSAAPAVKASYLLPLGVPAVAFFARGMQLLTGRLRGLVQAASAGAAIAAAVVFTNGVVFPVRVESTRRDPPWMSPGFSEVAARLDGASAGRWLGIRAEPLAGDGIVWRLLARSYPALQGAEVAAWCDAIDAAMADRAPGRRWRAVITQGSDSQRCAGRG